MGVKRGAREGGGNPCPNLNHVWPNPHFFILIRAFVYLFVAYLSNGNLWVRLSRCAYTQETIPLPVEDNTCRRRGAFRVSILADHTGDTVVWVFRTGVPPMVCTSNLAMHP